MKAPDQRVKAAIANLRNNTDFNNLVDFLDECLQEQREVNDSLAEDFKVRQGQGKAQILAEQLRLFGRQ